MSERISLPGCKLANILSVALGPIAVAISPYGDRITSLLSTRAFGVCPPLSKLP